MQKSILALAVVSAMTALAAPAHAADLTVDDAYVQENGSSLISGGADGGTMTIVTDGNVHDMLEALKKGDILGAITQDGVIQGAVGGQAALDAGTKRVLDFAGLLPDNMEAYAKRINSQLDPLENASLAGNTSLIIGDASGAHEPVVLGAVGGDLALNVGADAGVLNELLGIEPAEAKKIVRNGNSSIKVESGNVFGAFGGSLAANVNGITVSQSVISVTMEAPSVETVLNGNSTLSIGGHANAAGAFAGGGALALGGSAISTVTGNSNVTIDSKHDAQNAVSGAVVGVFGGGLAASTLNGTAQAEVGGSTTIDVTNGVVVGAFGGGAAATTELAGRVWDAVEGSSIGDKISVDHELLQSGGTATSISHDIAINVSGDAVTVGLAGGGLGVAWSGAEGGEANAVVETGNVTISLDGPVLSENMRGKLHGTALSLIDDFSAALSNPSVSGIIDLLDPVTAAINESQENYQGAHVGTVGGSILVAGMPSAHEGTKATATGTTGDVVIGIEGGYNVATLGGGMTVAYGKLEAKETAATSVVNSTKILMTGGDSVLTMAGGMAFASGSDGQNSEVESSSTVKSATIGVSGSANADGIFGGGLAIDDTGAANTNATATTNQVEIYVSGGTVQTANLSPLLELGRPGSDAGNPSLRSYVYETAGLASADHGNVAILGGGIATGGGALAESQSVLISLSGGTVKGNVYGGGMATLGGKSTVGTATIEVSGDATVEGDIYAGGLAGSEQHEAFDASYRTSESMVDEAAITIAGGTVKGSVHAGGYVYEGATSAASSVKKAVVKLSSAAVFEGEEIEANGVADAALNLIGDVDLSRTGADGAKLAAFNEVNVSGSLEGAVYEFGDKDETTFTGGPATLKFAADFTTGKTAIVGSDAGAGYVGFASTSDFGNGLIRVAKGAAAFGSADAASMAVEAAGDAGADAFAYVTGAVDFTDKNVTVGSAAGAASGLTIGSDAVLVADASGQTSVTGSTLEAGAGIAFDNVGLDLAAGETTQTVTIAGATGGESVRLDNILWSYDFDDGTDVFTLRERTAAEYAEIGLSDGDVIDFYGDLDGDSALRDRLDSGSYRGEANLKAGMNLAAAAGVQTAAIQGAELGIDAVSRRASLTRDYADGVTGYAEVSGVYRTMGGNADMNEMKVELGGVVVGGDFTSGDWTVGALANVGTGSVRGAGDNRGVENDVDYYGVEAYAAKRFGQFNVVGHVGYTRTKNDLTDSSIGYAKVDDLDADVWNVGVRCEMQFAVTDKSRLVPYVGINYLRVSTDGYTTSQGVSVSSEDQNLFTVPVGVAFKGTMTTASGWNWSPSADVAYVGAFGDRDVEATTRDGLASGSVSMDVWSENVVRTSFGLEAEKGGFGIGAMAGLAVGSDDTTGAFGQIRVHYAF